MDKLGDAVQLCGDLCAYTAAEIHTNTACLYQENIKQKRHTQSRWAETAMMCIIHFMCLGAGHTSAFVINCRAGYTEAQNSAENEKNAKMCKDCANNIVLCCKSRVEHIIGMCARLIAEHKVESMCGTAQRNAAFGAHSTQDSAQYHTEDRQAHKETHSSKASKQYHRAQKQAQKLAHGMTKQSREGGQVYHSCNSDQASASTQRFTHLLNEE